MIKAYGKIFLSVSLLSLPLASIGQTADTAQLYAQIQALSQKVQALQQQIANTRQEVQTTRRELRTAVHEFRSQLRLGVTSEEVKLLQEMLAADSAIYPEKLVTGYFGLLTKTALIRFQLKHGIEGVGEAGPQTRRALNALLKKSVDARGAILNLNASATSTSTASSTDGAFGNGAGREKILICHIPQGYPPAARTLTIAAPALNAHLAHGDSLGSCANAGDGSTGTSTPDIIAPVLSNISASSTASTTTHIVWTTNEPATSKVWYGALSPLDTASASFVTSAILTANHDLVISSGLFASTTYYYIVGSKDANNNMATSSQYSFITRP